MMTDQQLEAAARELCRLRGVDPEHCHGFDGHNGPWANTPAWQLALEEVKAAEQMRAALAVADAKGASGAAEMVDVGPGDFGAHHTVRAYSWSNPAGKDFSLGGGQPQGSERSMTNTLLPCPFCGGAAELLVEWKPERAWVHCRVCKASGASALPEAPAAAVAAWNRRAGGALPEPAGFMDA